MSTLSSLVVACYENSENKALVRLETYGLKQWLGHTMMRTEQITGTIILYFQNRHSILEWMIAFHPYQHLIRCDVIPAPPGNMLLLTLPVDMLELISETINRDIEYSIIENAEQPLD